MNRSERSPAWLDGVDEGPRRLAEASRVEQPLAEASRVEQPLAEASRVEQPLAEASRVEQPLAEGRAVSNSPLATAEPWDLVADGYAAEAPLVMEPFAEHALAVCGSLAPSARVLDVAAGPGTLALRLAPKVARVDAVDIAPKMIATLDAKAREARIEAKVHASVGDATALGFEDRTFDAAFCLFGLMFIPDRPRAWSELARVLRPGGVAVVSTWAPIQQSTLMVAMFEAIKRIDPSFQAPARDLASLENAPVLASEMQRGGFESVEVQPITHVLPKTSADELWERMVRSNVALVLLRQRLGEDVWSARTGEAKAALAETLARGPLETTALFARGRAPSAAR